MAEAHSLLPVSGFPTLSEPCCTLVGIRVGPAYELGFLTLSSIVSYRISKSCLHLHDAVDTLLPHGKALTLLRFHPLDFLSEIK